MKTYRELLAMNDDDFRRYARWEIVKPLLLIVGFILYTALVTMWLNSTLPRTS